jgi:hypothetical protein
MGELLREASPYSNHVECILVPTFNDPDNLWWPPDTIVDNGITVVEGSNVHNKVEYGRRVGMTAKHLYTLKQTQDAVIWACACGRTLSRRKFER